MKPLFKNEYVELLERHDRKGRGNFTVVKRRNAVAIVPIYKNRVILEVQYRPGANRYVYEIPAGLIEKGESAERAARRELKEETGYSAKVMKKLFTTYSSPGYSTEKIHVFVAYGLIKGKRHEDANEHIKVEHIRLGKALDMIEQNEIIDMKTIAAILFVTSFSKPKAFSP